MLFNLSLVLDNSGKVRLDLLKDEPLEAIDEYTMGKESHREIRADFEEEIRKFLEEQRDYTATFLKETSKKGRIVITYVDGNLHMLRVLYRAQKEKKNVHKVLKGILRVLKIQENPEVTIRLIEHQSFFLGSAFAYQEMSRARRSSTPRRANLQLVRNVLQNKLEPLLQRDFSKFYFYIRKIDAYLEQTEHLVTTPLDNGKGKKIRNLEVESAATFQRKWKLNRAEMFARVEQSELFHYLIWEHIQNDERASIKDVYLEYLEIIEADSQKRYSL